MLEYQKNNPSGYDIWYQKQLNYDYDKVASRKSSEDQVYIFPMVVHVMHNGGDEKISEEQVKSQIEIMNNDFRRMPGTIGYGPGVDMKIEFHLATIDPQGKPTNGVVYYQTPLTDLQGRDAELKALSRWNPDRYFNVYIVKEIGGGGGGTILGYAFFPMPDNMNKDQDGVVILYDHWGNIGKAAGSSAGRTATHECGHWVALHHPFNPSPNSSGCQPGRCDRSGDLVCDTPPSEKANFGSPERLNSCVNDDPDLPDNVHNYMDYANEYLSHNFTEGQRRRAVAAIEDEVNYQRIAMWQSDNHRKTGVGRYGIPIAKFWATNLHPCVNTPVQFVDHSYNIPDQHTWYFEGGTPLTSTEQNPKATYTKAGKYNVRLVVKNSTRPNDSSIKEIKGFITVHDTAVRAPYLQDFESDIFPPTGWKIINEDESNPRNNYTFELFRRGGGFQNSRQCARMMFGSYDGYNQLDHLISPTFDLSGMKNAKLDFAYAYRPYYTADQRYPLFFMDTLSLFISKDCGNSWSKIWEKGGDQLRTTRYELSNFIPSSDRQWRKDSIGLKRFIGDGQIQLRFQTKNGEGNHLYLDDIRLTDAPMPNGIGEQASLTDEMTIYPNPFSHTTEILFSEAIHDDVTIKVWYASGRVVHQSLYTQVNNRKIEINGEKWSDGVYSIQVKTGNRVCYTKLVKIN